MMDLKAYPAMRDSGISWLGEVPEHWQVRRGKALFRCVDARSATGREELLTVSSARGVVPRSSANVTMFKAESYVGYKLCWPGDLVINSLWAWGRGLGVTKHHGIVSAAYGVYRLHKEYSDYADYIHELVRSVPFNWELQVRSKGIWTSRLQLTDEAFLGAPFPVPPADEQAAIVRFLDYADGRLHHYLAAKQTLIKLMEEQKQAIIHHAVTRGVHRNIRLKPSGVASLGDVPEHWSVQRLIQVCEVIDPHPSHRNPPADDDGVPFLGVGDLSFDGEIVKVGYRVGRNVLDDQRRRFRIQNGDLAIGRVASVGKVTRLKPGDFCLSGRLAVLKPKIDSDFAFWSLASPSTQRQITLGTDLTTMGVLGVNKLKRIYMAVPPRNEQVEIVQFIRKELALIDPTSNRLRRELDLLLEYRRRLIADLVTGKLDVRGAVADLPDTVKGTAHDPDESLVEADFEGEAEDHDAATEVET